MIDGLATGRGATGLAAFIVLCFGLASCDVSATANPLPDNVGFDQIVIPRAEGKPLAGAVWYPSPSPASRMMAGFAEQSVAQEGAVSGRNLPLIVISHGALGGWFGHADTANALAHAGFVVAAVTHDEFGPKGTLNLVGRSAQLSTLIDFMLRVWRGHVSINASKIGVFGFSAGGFTALVGGGGLPDPSRIAPHCKIAPKEWSCVLTAQHRLDLAEAPLSAGDWHHDKRIEAVVIAAPALGYVFGRSGLAQVQMPVQLWQAGDDHVLAEPWNAEAVKMDLPHPPEFHLVRGADHPDFTAPCSVDAAAKAPALCRDPSGFDRAAFHTLFNAAVVTFFIHALGVSPPAQAH